VQTTVGTAVLGKEPARYLPASRSADRPFRYTAHDRPMTTPGCRSMARCKSDCPVAPLPGYPLNLTAPLTLVRVRRCRLWWLRLKALDWRRAEATEDPRQSQYPPQLGGEHG